jgi:nucleotide-binding universal stress UspA family protein
MADTDPDEHSQPESEVMARTSTEDAAPKRIVAGIDGSDSSIRALRWAADQAQLSGSALEAIMTWEWPINYGMALPFPSDFDPATETRKVLEGAVEEVHLHHPSLHIRSRLIEGHPAPVLVEASIGAELLVVGSRGHGEFAGMLLGSVSEHCAAHAYCPVVVIRDSK